MVLFFLPNPRDIVNINYEGRLMRKRHIFLSICIVTFIGLWIGTDPDSGIFQNIPYAAGLINILTSVSGGLFGLVILHYSRKFLMDYKSSDFNLALKAAKDDPVGAGLAAIAVAIMCLAYTGIIVAGFFAF